MIQPQISLGGNEGRDDQRVDRDARRAGHQRRDQDGGQPVAAVVDHPRRHDAGDGAGEARQQRNEGAAVQARAAHDAVHQERRARHVAEIFQQQDEQEEDDDLRQEHDHAADAGDHAVLQEALQQARRAACRGPAAPSASKPADSSSISGCAQANTAWNITNRMSSRIASPATGCSTHRIDPRRSRCRAAPAG